MAEYLARVDVAPPRASYAMWLGSYRNADLGRVALLSRDGRLILDVGEWSSRVGLRREPSGETTLILLDPPAARLGLQALRVGDRALLRYDDPPQSYLLVREATATRH